ncbi:HIRAN domain-containing protein [Arthrobacter sp. MDT1-65]
MNITGLFRRRRHSGPDLEAFYRSERQRAPYTGPAHGDNRDDYVSDDAFDGLLTVDADGRPLVHLVAADHGLEFALPDGQLIYYESPALRRFGILTCSTTAMAYYQNPKNHTALRNGQRLTAVKEPDNPYDPNAVVLKTVNPNRSIGYVNQARAAWVSEALNSSDELHAVVLQNHNYGPRVLLTTPAMFNHLCRHQPQ